MIRLSQFLLLGALVIAVSTPVHSQAPAGKRPLTHKDYGALHSLQSPSISPDGTYVAYGIGVQDGNSEMIVRNLATGKEYRQSRGMQSVTLPTRTSSTTRSGRSPVGSSSQLAFSPDSKFVLFSINPSRPERTKGKAKAPSSPSSPALGILELASGKLTRVERVRSFNVPGEGPAIVVYQRSSPSTSSDPSKGGTPAKGETPTKGKTPAKGETPTKGPASKTGTPPTPPPSTTTPPAPTSSTVIVRNLDTGKERTFADVSEFSLTRDGKLLVYAVAGKKEEANGVFAVSTIQETPAITVKTGAGKYSRLVWDDNQTQLAFFHTAKESGKPGSSPPEPRICHWKRPEKTSAAALLLPTPSAALIGLGLVAVHADAPTAIELTPNGKAELKPNMQFTDAGGLSFSDDGQRLYFSVAAAPTPPKPTKPGEQKAVVELWHYQDDFIQPVQKVRYNAKPNYRAVFHLNDRSCRQLADETMTQVQLAPRGDWAVGLDERPYRILVGSEAVGSPADSYLVHSRTGERKPIDKKLSSPPSFSPGGKYLLSFDGKDWQTISVPDGKRVNLTGKLGVSFVNELHDQPSTPPAYGFAGWTGNDQHVLLYDRYDIWLVAADGSSAKNLTASHGRKKNTSMRVVRLDSREKTFDPNKPLLVRAENESTRDTGFYRVTLTGAAPKLLVMGARNYSTPAKAKNGNRYIFTVSTFYDYPDLYTADADFREIKRISDVNPQKAKFIWGKAELIRYKNADGDPLDAVLIKPENFDPKKKYPMIVYIYERLSQNLHRFVTPQAGTSINPTFYASNGYLVLMPDISYTVGHPGQSAVKCVLPAIQSVVDRGFVDEKAIGIQGHSWGGYQTAYLITQTTRFKAAAAGAPVANMTSAYGGIRWGSGLPRQFQYEKTQSRIGGTLWEYPTRFLENSPLFHADRIKTPLMMLHNDKDEAVPWQQGIEYYLALRRLGKEVYLFNYPGEFHGLRQRVNQRDYTVRMQEFFDHHLKGAPKPEWMAKGLPYTPPPSQPTTPTTPGRRGRFGARTSSSAEPE